MEHRKTQEIWMVTDLICRNLRLLFFSMFLFIGCLTYDKPIIYHKNFQPGTHDKLRFDGYYTNQSTFALSAKIRPMFLYRDGSVWYAEEDITALELNTGSAMIMSNIKHSWGNYKVQSDTIFVERFVQETNTGNFNRVIMKGIVQDSAIFWQQRTYHKSAPDSVNYDVRFYPLKTKPDSTKNWTRTHPPYNK